MDAKGGKIIKSDGIGIENIYREVQKGRETETEKTRVLYCKKINRTPSNCATTLSDVAHMHFTFLKNVCVRLF